MLAVPTSIHRSSAAADSASLSAWRTWSSASGGAAASTAASSRMRRSRYRSATSSAGSIRTKTPRLSSWTSSRSWDSSRNASRSVFRDTPRATVSPSSDSRVPGANMPSVIRVRSTSVTRSVVLPRSSATRSAARRSDHSRDEVMIKEYRAGGHLNNPSKSLVAPVQPVDHAVLHHGPQPYDFQLAVPGGGEGRGGDERDLAAGVVAAPSPRTVVGLQRVDPVRAQLREVVRAGTARRLVGVVAGIARQHVATGGVMDHQAPDPAVFPLGVQESRDVTHRSTSQGSS